MIDKTKLPLIHVATVVLITALSACATPGGTMGGSVEPTEETFQQDRKAILSQAGEYSVDFQFKETLAVREGYELTKPYLSKANEIVELIEDSGKKIDLQHILLVTKGDKSRVVKHWRQTWIYEPEYIYEFKGLRTWEPRKLSRAEARGKWAQIVYQVDDSPRYTGVGRWHHDGNLSSWESRSWRPLPRREYTKRSDYQVLVARNRHTLTPTGWVHEQDNYKLVLGDKENPIIAREVGFNVYDRVEGFDFSPVRKYWKATGEFWSHVRKAWASIRDGKRTVQLKHKWKGRLMFMYMFALAQNVITDPAPEKSEGRIAKMKAVLDGFLVAKPEPIPTHTP